MDLTLNHLDIFSKSTSVTAQALLPILGDPILQCKARLLISAVLTGSSHCHPFCAGSLVSHVNGIPCDTVADLREALLMPVTNSEGRLFCTITTCANEFSAIPLLESIEEETFLSSVYHYPPSGLLELLSNQIRETTSNQDNPIQPD